MSKREGPDRLTLRLENAGYLGDCVGRSGGMVVFAAYGLPGEEVVVELEARRSRYARGAVVEVLSPSPRRVVAPCSLYGACGGCSWQHADYENELEIKQSSVASQLARIGGFESLPISPIIASGSPWRYRNQGRFSIGEDGSLGFTRPRSRSVLAVDECLIMQPAVDDVLQKLQGHTGRLHQVVIRYGARTGETLVAPELPGISDLATGQPLYHEDVLGRVFQVSAYSFFQVNTLPVPRDLPDGVRLPDGFVIPESGLSQTDLLALLVMDRLDLQPRDHVLDAYCGVGTFALLIADRVERVVGIEESTTSVADARENSRGIANFEIRQGRVEALLPNLGEPFDAVVLDPSRVGCAPETIAALIDARPERIVYVSCDAATLARDLKMLGDAAYDVVDVQPVDMFPRTRHVECVATLRAR